MASDDKKTKTSPAPENEAAVNKEAPAKKKDEGQPKHKITSDADLSKAEGSEKAAKCLQVIAGVKAKNRFQKLIRITGTRFTRKRRNDDWASVDLGHLLRRLVRLGVALSPAVVKPRLTAGIDPARRLFFVNPMQSERALNVLRHALGGKRCEYVLALLAFIRTAHFWTLTHPDNAMEDGVKELLEGHKELATLLLQAPEPWPA